MPGASKDLAILNKLRDFELSAEVHDFDLMARAAESSYFRVQLSAQDLAGRANPMMPFRQLGVPVRSCAQGIGFVLQSKVTRSESARPRLGLAFRRPRLRRARAKALAQRPGLSCHGEPKQLDSLAQSSHKTAMEGAMLLAFGSTFADSARFRITSCSSLMSPKIARLSERISLAHDGACASCPVCIAPTCRHS